MFKKTLFLLGAILVFSFVNDANAQCANGVCSMNVVPNATYNRRSFAPTSRYQRRYYAPRRVRQFPTYNYRVSPYRRYYGRRPVVVYWGSTFPVIIR